MSGSFFAEGKGREERSLKMNVRMSKSPKEKTLEDGFAGFLANPQALQRGGPALQALRRGGAAVQGGLLERLAQAETNRFWRAEIAAKSERRRFSSLNRASRQIFPKAWGRIGLETGLKSVQAYLVARL